MGSSSVHPWYKERNSGHQLDGSLILPAYALTQSFGCLIGFCIVFCLGLVPLAVASPVDGVVSDLGLAPLAVVECHESPSLFGTVASDCVGRHVAMGVDELQASPCSSATPSGPFEEASQVSQAILENCPDHPGLYYQTHCLLCWALGQACVSWFWCWIWVSHSACWSDSQPCQANFFPQDSYWCGCCWWQLEEWYKHSSLSWEQGILEGLLEGVWECTSLGTGTLCGGLWLCCCCLPLLYECLHVGQEHLIDELCLGHLKLVASEWATTVDILAGWDGLSILWLCPYLNSEWVGVHPLPLGQA